jgi:hypothetical protein
MPIVDKLKVGKALVHSLVQDKGLLEMKLWCLGRLGSRQPLSGGAEFVIPADQMEDWVKTLLEHPEWSSAGSLSALVECSRKCGDRRLDISDALRTQVVEFLQHLGEGAESHLLMLVERGGQRSLSEQSQVLGEALPVGLHLQ